MAAKYQTDGLNLTSSLLSYVRASSVRESVSQSMIRTETAPLPDSQMMISPEQGSVMAWLFRLLKPRRIVEVGVFTGYSATWLASALEDGGELIACDANEATLSRAVDSWREAGLQDRIRPLLGPAAETLNELLGRGWAASVDAMFIDADKTGYGVYYELGLELLRPGGVVLFDNVLWGGRVADDGDQSPDTVALRRIVAQATDDPRVHSAMLTDGDGLLAVLKRD
jgi:predicted O-methyltransferase YrrM